MNLRLGIDTGGTYTDAVLVDSATQAVHEKSKSLTTRHNLIEGIAASIGKTVGQKSGQISGQTSGNTSGKNGCKYKPEEIKLVCLSTTCL